MNTSAKKTASSPRSGRARSAAQTAKKPAQPKAFPEKKENRAPEEPRLMLTVLETFATPMPDSERRLTPRGPREVAVPPSHAVVAFVSGPAAPHTPGSLLQPTPNSLMETRSGALALRAETPAPRRKGRPRAQTAASTGKQTAAGAVKQPATGEETSRKTHGRNPEKDRTAPLVSVIMNCRNGAPFLRQTINSVFAQTFSDWELIFWDNASEDGSPMIAKSFKDKRLRYFRAEMATPLGEARNLALAQARGKYIAFLDCDDLWAPEKLERQVKILDTQPDVGLVCTDTVIFSGRSFVPGSRGAKKRMFRVSAPHRGMVFRELMTAGWIAMSSVLIRKAALDSLDEAFDPSFNVAEEADLFYRIAHDWELDYIAAPLTGWRVHGGNNTFRRIGDFAAETRRILQKHERLYPKYADEYADVVALLSRRAAFQAAVALWRDGEGAKARQEIAAYPVTPKIAVFRLLSYLPGSFFEAAALAYQFLPAALRR